jgi:hypothetical protein
MDLYTAPDHPDFPRVSVVKLFVFLCSREWHIAAKMQLNLGLGKTILSSLLKSCEQVVAIGFC